MLNRRELLSTLTATGIGTTALHRAVIGLGSFSEEITSDVIRQAEWITDIELSEEDRKDLVEAIKQSNNRMSELRKVKLDHSIPPAMHFKTLAQTQPLPRVHRNAQPSNWSAPRLPDSDEAIAFLPVTELAAHIRSGKLTSLRLTKIYLERLKKYGPMLRCVVTLTEESAIKQAKKADREIAAGQYRGPLHGIPWGAKDLIAVKGHATTWGIPVFIDRELDETATVAQRLESAGAVLVAKLSLGAIAMGDLWFEGRTRNPRNPRFGSSGSSAGSASATVAGLVGFSLGSETLGSILSPCRRCGASGLRPTYGRVSRHGCMPLSWSMDKIGPICRSIEDCALVFDAIHGADGLDATANNYDFNWPSSVNVSQLKIGITKGRQEIDEREDLAPLKQLGCKLVEITLPPPSPMWAMTKIIDIEGAAVFDELLRAGETEGWNTWTRTFQAAQFISAIDYLRFQRARTKLMHEFEEAIEGVDILFNANDLVYTNFTGHPSAVLPRAFRGTNNQTPVSSIFTGHVNQDATVLAIANAYQKQVDAHLQNPSLDPWLEKFEDGSLDKPKPDEKKEAKEDPKKSSDK